MATWTLAHTRVGMVGFVTALLLPVTVLADHGHGIVPESVDEALCGALRVTVEHECIWFEDAFDGTAVDPTKWDTSIATSGVRICGESVANFFSGVWKDHAALDCHGVMQGPPYGTVSVGGGTASLAAGVEPRGFPFLYTGPSNRLAFPPAGDFALELRLRFTSIQIHGDGLHAFVWTAPVPAGVNTPGAHAFQVWADTRGNSNPGIAIVRVGGERYDLPSAISTAWHDYRVVYEAGAYTAYVDGAPVLGPIVWDVRPDSLWLGNPTFTFWAANDWTDFEIDHLRVTVPPVTAGLVP